MLTMGQAAKEAGTSKATISRAIASGRLSATRNDKGGWDIQPAELFRVFPRNTATGSGNGDVKQTATPVAMADETPALQAAIEGLKAQLALIREQLDDVKGQRDSWQKQAENAQRLLVDARPRRGLFGFLKAG